MNVATCTHTVRYVALRFVAHLFTCDGKFPERGKGFNAAGWSEINAGNALKHDTHQSNFDRSNILIKKI